MTPSPVPAEATSRQVWAALWVVYIVWGSTYLGIKVVVDAGIPPLLGMGSRFIASGLLIAAFLVARRGWSVMRVNGAQVRSTLIVGVLLLLVGNGGVAIAEQTVPSGVAALLVGAVPLWMALLRVASGQRPTAATWTGIALGFVGIALISLTRGGVDGVQTWGVVVLLVATLGWSWGSFLSPRLSLPRDPLVATSWEMLLGGGVMLAVSLISGSARGFDPAAVPTSGWVGLIYLITVGSLAGYTAYVWLLGHASLSLVSTYAYVNPVIAVLLGWLILSERVTIAIGVGGLVTVLGVALVVRGERGSRPPAHPPAERDQSTRGAEPTKPAATSRTRSNPSASPRVTRTPSSP